MGIWQKEEVVHSLFPNTYINLNHIECRITWDIIIGSFHFTPTHFPDQLKEWGKGRKRQAGADFIYPNEILPAYKWTDECK